MMTSKVVLAGIAAFGIGGSALAQGRASQTVEVPAGAFVLVIPADMMPMARSSFAPSLMPVFEQAFEPVAMMRQMDAMMANARKMMDAAAMPSGSGVAGVMVSSFSDGHGTCTRRVTYGGNGAAPVVQVSGDACGPDGTPAALPPPQLPPTRAVPRTLEVRNRVPPIEVASAR